MSPTRGLVLCLLASQALAQPRTGGATPDTRGTSLNGGWFVQGSAPRASGPCPPGSALMGGAHVDQTGQFVRLRFTLGFTCQPAAVCQYEGTITGGRLRLSNSVVVDGEGGKVTNTLDLVIESNDRLSGTSTSTYQHPEGDRCTWTSSVEIGRKPDDGSQDPTRNTGLRQGPGAGTGQTSGPGGSGTSGTAPPGSGQSTSTPGAGSGTTAPTTPPGTSGTSPPSTGTPSGTGAGGSTPPGGSTPGTPGGSTPGGSTAPGGSTTSGGSMPGTPGGSTPGGSTTSGGSTPGTPGGSAGPSSPSTEGSGSGTTAPGAPTPRSGQGGKGGRGKGTRSGSSTPTP